MDGVKTFERARTFDFNDRKKKKKERNWRIAKKPASGFVERIIVSYKTDPLYPILPHV